MRDGNGAIESSWFGRAHDQLVALVAQLDRVAVVEVELRPTRCTCPRPVSTGTYEAQPADSQPASSWADGSAGLPYTVTDDGRDRAPCRTPTASAARHGVITRPGQVGVAGRVVVGALAQRGRRVGVADDVGDPPVGEHAERVVGDDLGRLGVPPRDDRARPARAAAASPTRRAGPAGRTCAARRPRPARAGRRSSTSASSRGTGASMLWRSTMSTRIGCLRRGDRDRGLDLGDVLLLERRRPA